MEENDAFDILNDISEYVTLVQLMNSLGNVNRAISIVGYQIFDRDVTALVNCIEE